MLGALEREAQRNVESERDEPLRRVADAPTIAVKAVLGMPAQEIVAEARREPLDLIVMGTHGRTGLRHLVLGSVAERVVRLSPVPVLTIRPADAGATVAAS
jgi:nucleotide-binding universal stress UspA family protein